MFDIKSRVQANDRSNKLCVEVPLVRKATMTKKGMKETFPQKVVTVA